MPVFKIINPENVKPGHIYRLSLDADMVSVLVKMASENHQYWTEQAIQFILEGIKKDAKYWPIPRLKEEPQSDRDKIPKLDETGETTKPKTKPTPKPKPES